MQTRLRPPEGITFASYQVPQQAARKVYASKAELTDVIYRAFTAPARQNNRTPKKENKPCHELF